MSIAEARFAAQRNTWEAAGASSRRGSRAHEPSGLSRRRDLVSAARKAGRAIAGADAYIVATAASDGFAVATRDTAPFEAAGLRVINPEQARPVTPTA
ncbi:MAG: hypothetical protein U0795_00190 [Pirellulales bacterium]